MCLHLTARRRPLSRMVGLQVASLAHSVGHQVGQGGHLGGPILVEGSWEAGTL